MLGLGVIALVAPESQTKSNNQTSITVTGCLQKSDEAGIYSITDENRKHYDLRTTESTCPDICRKMLR